MNVQLDLYGILNLAHIVIAYDNGWTPLSDLPAN
jgi:hypothetical protein